MKKRMNRSEILFLLLSFYGAASAFAFQASLEVVSHNTAVDPHQLYFGMTAGASDNYDAGIDGFAPPTPQEPVRLDAYFPVSDPLVTRLVNDYRGVNASVTYTLKIRADIDPGILAQQNKFTLSWNVADVPVDFTHLQLSTGAVADFPNVDMRQQDELTLDPSTDNMSGKYYDFQITLSQTNILLTLESHDSTVDRHYLRLGMAAEASEGYDAGIDGFAPGAPPGDIELEAYFPVSHPLISRLLTDYRPVSDTATYVLKVQADNSPFSIDWGDLATIRIQFSSIRLKVIAHLDSQDTNHQGLEIDMRQDEAFDFSTGKYEIEISLAKNSPPVAISPTMEEAVAINEDTDTTITLIGTDTDGDDLIFVVGQPRHGIVVLNGNVVTYTPDANYHGSDDSFTFKVNDGMVDSRTVTVPITIVAVNDAPVFSLSGDVTLEEDFSSTQQVTVSPEAVPADESEQTVTYSLSPTAVDFASVSIDSSTGQVSILAVGDGNGTQVFTLTADDGQTANNLATQTFTLTIDPVNDAPDFSLSGDLTVAEDFSGIQQVTVTPEAVPADESEQTVTYSLSPITVDFASVVIDSSTGQISISAVDHQHGRQQFTVIADDQQLANNLYTQTFTLTINPVNDAPLFSLSGEEVTIEEDFSDTQQVTVSPEAVPADESEQTVTYSLSPTAVDFASVVIDSSTGQVSISAVDHQHGRQQFTVTANDQQSANNLYTQTFTLTINPVNDAPVATDLSASVAEDGAVDITLSSTDLDNDNLTFTLSSQPTNGTTNLNGAIVNYAPNPDYNGQDIFTFQASDGTESSQVKTVTVTVTAVNDSPAASDLSATTNEDVSVQVTLTAQDVENDDLTYTILEPPVNGTATLADSVLTYQPNINFSGTDATTYQASDGVSVSQETKITITVDSVNDPPIAQEATVNANEDTVISIILSATDVENDTLSYSLASQPSHGAVTIEGAVATYRPALDYHGTDAFTFKVNDGTDDSNVASINLTIATSNDAPVAQDQTLSVSEDQTLALVLKAEDVDQDSLGYTVTKPGQGQLSGTAPDLTYRPNANYHGNDSFSFKASDGSLESSLATVTISVQSVNDTPQGVEQSIAVDEDGVGSILLVGSDADSDSLTFSLASQPSHGSATLEGAVVTYIPDTNHNGSDSFTFKVNDGTADSSTATISLTIAAINDAPVAQDQTLSVNEDQTLTLVLDISDIDQDSLTYTVTQPSHGQLSGTAPDLTYRPNANYYGSDSFSFQASDGVVSSSLATVTITIQSVNDAPVADSLSFELVGSASQTLTLNGSDVDSSSLSYQLVTPPTAGTLSQFDGASVIYTPNRGTVGSDQFTFKVIDDLETESQAATVTLAVNAPAPLWELVFTASSSHNNVASQQVAVGVYQESTEAYDQVFDVVAPPSPQAPVLLEFYAYQPLHNPATTRRLIGYYSAPGAVNYRLAMKLRADQQPVTLSWSGLETVAESYPSLRLIGNNIDLDLRQQKSLTINAQDGVVQILEVSVSQQVQYSIDLAAGWNMISIPGRPVDSDPKALIGDSRTIIPTLYWWNPTIFSYVPVTQLVAGQGYWILTLKPEGEQVSLAVEPLSELTLGIQAGWNMIGGLQQSTAMPYGSEEPTGSILANTLYNWNASQFTYQRQSQLEGGKGYWVLSFEACTLKLSNQTAAAPAVVSMVTDKITAGLRQPELLIRLTFSSQRQYQALQIGLDTDGRDGLDPMDRPVPPTGPEQSAFSATLAASPYPLRRDIKTLASQVSWQIDLSTGQPATLTVGGIEGLPPLIKDQELVLRDGEKEQVIVDGSQVELDPASRQLEIIWRRQRPPITQLLQNYPNPFNPESWIPFDLAAEAVVKIEIYSQKGILVRRLFLGYTDAGIYRQKERAAYWDGRNAMGEPVSSGIYFYQIQADDYRQMRKMVILK